MHVRAGFPLGAELMGGRLFKPHLKFHLLLEPLFEPRGIFSKSPGAHFPLLAIVLN